MFWVILCLSEHHFSSHTVFVLRSEHLKSNTTNSAQWETECLKNTRFLQLHCITILVTNFFFFRAHLNQLFEEQNKTKHKALWSQFVMLCLYQRELFKLMTWKFTLGPPFLRFHIISSQWTAHPSYTYLTRWKKKACWVICSHRAVICHPGLNNFQVTKHVICITCNSARCLIG